MNLSRFLSRKTRKASEQISKALLGNSKKIEFAEELDINTSKLTDTGGISLMIKNTLGSHLQSYIVESQLNNKKEDVLTAILGSKGAAYNLSDSIYTSGSSNFKKVFAPFTKMEYKNDQILLNNTTIDNTKIDTLLRNLKRYLKMNDGAISEEIDNTHDNDTDGIFDIKMQPNKYTDVNKKFNEGGLIAQLKILVCLLLLYYLTAEAKNKAKTVSESESNPKSCQQPSPPPSDSFSSSSSSSVPRNLPKPRPRPKPRPVHPGNINADTARKEGIVCYDEATYEAADIDRNNLEKKKNCQQLLDTNVKSGIARLEATGVKITIMCSH